MSNIRESEENGLLTRRALVGVVTVLALSLLLTACSQAIDSTITPQPVSPTPAPIGPTAALAPTPQQKSTSTAMPLPTLRPFPTPKPPCLTDPYPYRRPNCWTIENPATLQEIEAQIEIYRGERLTVSSDGGAYQNTLRRAYSDWFEELFGIEVIYKDFNNTTDWPSDVHIVDLPAGDLLSKGESGELEELEFSIIDNRYFLETLVSPFIGGGVLWSTVLAFNTDTYPEGHHPMSMAEFYDTDRFPGRRAWGYYPEAEMAFVLLSEDPSLLEDLAGKASLGALSEDQVDRAFVLFESYREQIFAVYDDADDCPAMLAAGEIEMCTGSNAAISEAIREGAPIKICWECGHLIHARAWGIPKDLKEERSEAFALAQLYMGWVATPPINHRLAQFSDYGIVNLKAVGEFHKDITEYNPLSTEYNPLSPYNLQYALINDHRVTYSQSEEWRSRYRAFIDSLE